jgi:hypothetical protein
VVVNPPLGTATIFKIMMTVLPASFAEKVRHTYPTSHIRARSGDPYSECELFWVGDFGYVASIGPHLDSTAPLRRPQSYIALHHC